MIIFVSVQAAGEDVIRTLEDSDVAAQILEFFGGDPATDTCTVSITSTPVTVTVGGPPTPSPG
jgi:hypothetical protein